MGRFGIRNYAENWSEPVAGARPLIASDRARTGATLAAIALVSAVPTGAPLWIPPAGLILSVAVAFAARVPAREVWKRLAAVLPFGILAIGFVPWAMPGPRIDFAGLTLSQPGLRLAAVVTVKLVSVALLLSYLSATTPVPRLFAALRALRVPGVLVDILESTVRYLGTLAGEARQMMLSCRLRATVPVDDSLPVRWRRLVHRFSRFAALVAGLFLRTLKRGERCEVARASREIPPATDEITAGTDARHEILIEGLCHAYPGSAENSLSGVTLNIPRGKRIAILGANGAGKTTLLLHLNGVLLAASGRVTVGGIEVTRSSLATIRRRVGMVFQNPDDQVFAPTVLQDVRYGPEQAGHDEATCESLAREALSAVGLWTLRDRAPFSLSQGQRKRAAIAGVLAAGSDILLFDEPMASLDPAGKDEIQVLLNDLHAAGKTLVVATHDVDFAAAWADGVILMGNGQVVAMGAPDLLVNEPVMTLAGLALPLVSRPFEQLRPFVKHERLGLERLPASVDEAFAWLRYHFVEKGRRPFDMEKAKDREFDIGSRAP
jgi:cobalt transport protein ATP-binding subunit